MKEKLNTKQGISLIVLVITIIVIIILAVAVILTLANNNPIENARRAVDDNNEATLKEEATLLYADWYTQSTLGTLEPNYKDKAQDYVRDKLSDGYTEDLLAKLNVSNDGKITIGKKESGPVIPNGFIYKEGTVDTGYVIKNKTDGNEFVWVPVEKGSFKRDGFGIDISAYFEPYKTDEYTSEEEEYLAMVASVEKYGGFYMGRYEASKKTVDGVDIAQSIANVTPWADIAWCESGMTGIGTNGAVAKARAVYPAENATVEGDAVSTLPYGIQWDATVRWIKDSKEEYKNITSDSSTFGNYSSEGTIPTGSEPSYALNNIYDMAGNLNEWTMEAHTDDYRSFRGGYYENLGNIFTVSGRFYNGPSAPGGYIDMGFRLALYIKS